MVSISKQLLLRSPSRQPIVDEIMQKPYIKQIDTISKFTVWLVDGKYIRENIDEEFTNFGQHYRFKFIPLNEFWIDHERVPGEEYFFIHHLLVENRLMAAGMSYRQAIDKADLAEKRERRKVDIGQKGLRVKPTPEKLAMIHGRLLKTYCKYLSIWIVDGRAVRDLYDIDFTEGGHDKVYPFVPPGEIWLDDDLTPGERKFVLLHELHERHLMSGGMSYPQAHYDSSHIEYYCRQHPEEHQGCRGQDIPGRWHAPGRG